MKLKICGLTKPLEVETCVLNEVNYCGFILNFPKSHRNLSFEKARELTNIEKNKTKYVGVLVNPIEKELDDFSKLKFDYFQIIGGIVGMVLHTMNAIYYCDKVVGNYHVFCYKSDLNSINKK